MVSVSNRIVEYVFFFGFFGLVAYVVWQIISPLISALALAIIIVVISYPLYEKVVPKMPKQNRSLAALVTTLVAMFAILTPLLLIALVLFGEAESVYNLLSENQQQFTNPLLQLESTIQAIVPTFEINISDHLKQAAGWVAGSLDLSLIHISEPTRPY